jgi:hypothetical protein
MGWALPTAIGVEVWGRAVRRQLHALVSFSVKKAPQTTMTEALTVSLGRDLAKGRKCSSQQQI